LEQSVGFEIERLDMAMRNGIEVTLNKFVLKVLEEIDPTTMIHAMLEFNSKSLVLSRRAANLLQKEPKG